MGVTEPRDKTKFSKRTIIQQNGQVFYFVGLFVCKFASEIIGKAEKFRIARKIRINQKKPKNQISWKIRKIRGSPNSKAYAKKPKTC